MISQVTGLRGLAHSVLWLLDTAMREVERDREAAKIFLTRAKSLLQIELDQAASTDGDFTSGGLAPWQAQRVTAFIDLHLSAPIRVEDLSDLVRLSKTHFSRGFRKVFGETPHAYIVRRRVDLVCRLMLTRQTALSELALECGFADQAHLCRQFRRVTGMSSGGLASRTAPSDGIDLGGRRE